MGQADILKLLEKRKVWMTTREIAKILKINNRAISRALTKLYPREVFKRDERVFKRRFKWKAKN